MDLVLIDARLSPTKLALEIPPASLFCSPTSRSIAKLPYPALKGLLMEPQLIIQTSLKHQSAPHTASIMKPLLAVPLTCYQLLS